jgi:outer membrane protein assembly factor BamA
MFPTDTENEEDVTRRRFTPMIYYSNPDRIFAGVKFRIGNGRIGDNPYGFEHSVQLRYSLQQNAFSVLYDARFSELIGKWNLSFNAYYDWVVWTHFFGLGNETQKLNHIRYYRLSTSEYAGNISINRIIKDHHFVDIAAYLQGIEVLNRPGTFAEEHYIHDESLYFDHHIYTSLKAGYTYQNVDDHVLPTKGIMAYGGAGYTLNTHETTKSFAKYSGILQLFLPLGNKFSLSLRAAGSAVQGTPEFFQYVSVGGPVTIRGYFRDRFWGNAMFYNSNELRWITDLKVRKYNNKIGIVAFFDDGRVWLDNEKSDKLHYGYGGGLLFSPMHKFTAYATYARSEEGGMIQFKVTKLLSRFPASRSLYN